MKKNIVRFLLVALVGGVVFAACDKNDSDPVPEQAKKLTKKSWKIVDITVPKSDATGDSSVLKSCMSDDLITFTAEGSFNFNDSTAKCDSTIFPYSKGIWGYKLGSDSILLGVKSPAERYISWKVSNLTDSTMKVIYTDSVMIAGKKINKTISFKH